MPEWSNGTVLKTVVGQLTQGSNPCLSAIIVMMRFWKGGRVVECAPLLRVCTVYGTEGSNPSLSAILF